MRLKNIKVPPEAGIMNNIERQIPRDLAGRFRECYARFDSRQLVTNHLRRQRSVAKPLANDMQLVAASDDLGRELPTPLAHSAPPRV
jgi:hypothetical protein